jgi:hypothetical protein
MPFPWLSAAYMAQAVVASYGGTQAQIAISRQLSYEEASDHLEGDEAASDSVKEVLAYAGRTRGTQAISALVLILTIGASLALAVYGKNWGDLAVWLPGPTGATVLFFVNRFLGPYWRPHGRASVPKEVPPALKKDFEETQKRTESLLQVMGYLVYTSLLVFAVSVTVGF